MRFFTFIAAAFAATATASETFTQAEKEELFEMWASQVERGEMDQDTFLVLAQALDGNMPPEFYAETGAEDDDVVDFAESYSMTGAEIDAELEQAFSRADMRQ